MTETAFNMNALGLGVGVGTYADPEVGAHRFATILVCPCREDARQSRRNQELDHRFSSS